VTGAEGERAPLVLDADNARRLEECLADGGVAVFPADTVYGLCCDPQNEQAVSRLYTLKGRATERPAAVMFFSLERALGALPELASGERAALEALLPGPVTVLLPNRRRCFPLACAVDPATLGLRVPRLPDRLAALGAVRGPVMQSSANISGEREARSLAEVLPRLRREADLVLDGGELPGVPSTVIDLRDYERRQEWRVVREGALSTTVLECTFASLA
jgi:L-threonylcarbamoyladenylate synthase